MDAVGVWVAVSEDVRVDEEVGRAVLDPVPVAVWLGVVVTNPLGVTVGDLEAVAVVDPDCVAVIVQEAVGVGDQTDTVAVWLAVVDAVTVRLGVQVADPVPV